MKKYYFFSLFLLLSGFIKAQEAEYAKGKLFVKLKGDHAFSLPAFPQNNIQNKWESWPGIFSLIDLYKVAEIKNPFRTNDPRLQCIYEIRFDKSEFTNEFIFDLQKLSFVDYAERIPVYKIDFTPDDMNFFTWQLPLIQAEEAWDISTGNPEVKVAIVDDAIKITHEDLQAKIWINPNEIAGNSIDDDNNGFIDDVKGWDVADDDNDPNPPAGATDNTFSHGTHVSGIAGAETDNGTGVASIGFNVSLIPIKTKFDTTIGTAELDNTYGGVDYAITIGADVVNMSFGGMGFSSTFQALVTVGYDSGMVFCASAGNDGQMTQRFPAGYEHVISVASTEYDDTKSGFSNYFYSVDVSAPGNPIYSCTAGSNSGYGIMGGTSMSAPLTSGLCGLILSVNPDLNPDELEICLEYGCDNINAENPDYIGLLGAGRINAKNSLECAQNPSIGIKNPEEEDISVTFWPNPASENIHLKFKLTKSGETKITLYDMQGKICKQLFHGFLSVGDHEIESSLPGDFSGAMMVEVETPNGKEQKLLFVGR